MLSVIIPTLNAAVDLERCLSVLPEGFAGEVIVSDGGSVDDTAGVATRHRAMVITGPSGRGGQLARGATLASGDWLLFLHADTYLDGAAIAALCRHMAGDRGVAAALRFRLDDQSCSARLLEAVVALRCWLLRLPYGDQGLLISRALYDAVGGFQDMPLMEDVDFVRRLGRRRIAMLPADAVTSAMRYRRHGYLRRMVRNVFCLALYGLGVAPERIRRIYEK